MNRDDFYFFWRHQFGQWTMRNITDANGITYNCCEQYMMYQKAMLFGDLETAEKILAEQSPAKQKDLGREVKGFDSKTWERHRFDIVGQGNFLKFTQHVDLRERLLATGDKILAEASPVDLIWGVGFAEKDDAILDMNNWTGLNLLGKVLMKVRELLRKPYAHRIDRFDRYRKIESIEREREEILGERNEARQYIRDAENDVKCPWKYGRYSDVLGIWTSERSQSPEGVALQTRIDRVVNQFPEIPEYILTELIRSLYDLRTTASNLSFTSAYPIMSQKHRIKSNLLEYSILYPEITFPLNLDAVLLDAIITPEEQAQLVAVTAERAAKISNLHKLSLRDYVRQFPPIETEPDLCKAGLWSKNVRIKNESLNNPWGATEGRIGWYYPATASMFDMTKELPVLLTGISNDKTTGIGFPIEDLEVISD